MARIIPAATIARERGSSLLSDIRYSPFAYLLVDFENVQPSTLGTHVPPESDDSYVMLFAGEQQSKIDLSLAKALQPFGPRAEYIQIVGTGKDALDFHIAYYIGRLAAEHPGAKFIILSKDTGFDPLIKQLTQHNVTCIRVRSIDDKAPAKAAPPKPATKAPAKAAAKAPTKTPKKPSAPTLSKSQSPSQQTAPSNPATASAGPQLQKERFDEIVKRLDGLKGARPGTIKTLRSSVMAWFKPALSSAQMDIVMRELQSQKLLAITGNKVTYGLLTRQN